MTAAPVVLRFGALGDMVMTTPILRALHKRYGQPCTVVALGGWVPSLFKHLPSVGAIYTVTSRKAPYWCSPEQWAVVRHLRTTPDAPVYVLAGEERSAALVKRAGLAITASCYGAGYIPNEHQVDNHARLAGFDASEYDRKPRLVITDDERTQATAWLQQRHGDAPTIFVHVGNKKTMSWRRRSGNVKEWPLEKWLAVIRGVRERSPAARIMLTGSPGEREMTQGIAAAVADNNVQSIAGETPLRQLLALLSVGHSCISVDTGPAHAAAAVGCPLVVLFGATDPRVNGPIATTGPVKIVTGPPDAPVVDGEVAWAAQHSMGAITPAAVLDAWSKLDSH